MHSLGRPFELGMVYNCCIEKLLLTEKVCLNETNPRETFLNLASPSISWFTGDSMSQKSSFLNVDDNLAVSILLGLTKPQGATQVIKDHLKLALQERVILHLKYARCMKELDDNFTINESIARRTDGTHYVSRMTYGNELLIVFDKTHLNEQYKCQSHLKQKLESFFSQIVCNDEEEARSEELNSLKEENMRYTVYGNGQLSGKHLDIQDVVKRYKRFMKMEFENSVISITLCPITEIRQKGGVNFIPLQSDVSSMIFSLDEEFENLKVLYNELSDMKSSKMLKLIRKQLERMSTHMLEQHKKFLGETRNHVVASRKKVDEKIDKNFLCFLSQQGAIAVNLCKWLKIFSGQIHGFNAVCSVIPEDVEKVHDLNRLNHLAMDMKNKNTLYLTYQMYDASDLLKFCIGRQSLEKKEIDIDQFLENKVSCFFTNDMNEKTEEFINFHRNNRDLPKKRTKLVLVEKYSDSQNVSAKLELHKLFTVVSANFKVSKAIDDIALVTASHDELSIKWNARNWDVGNVIYYQVQYSFNNQSKILSTIDDKTEIIITGLRTGTQYQVKCRACFEIGVGPWSQKPFMVSTKLIGSPMIVSVRQTSLKSISIEWKKPDEWDRGLNIKSMILFLKKQEQEDWSKDPYARVEIVNEDIDKNIISSIVEVPTNSIISLKLALECTSLELSGYSNTITNFTVIGDEQNLQTQRSNDSRDLELFLNNLELMKGADVFEFTQHKELDRLLCIIKKVPEKFKQKLSEDAFVVFLKMIYDYRDLFDLLEKVETKHFLREILDEAVSVNFSYKKELSEWVSSGRSVKRKTKKKVEKLINSKHTEDVGEIFQKLEILKDIANEDKEYFLALLRADRFNEFYESVARQKLKLQGHQRKSIHVYLENLFELVGDLHFAAKKQLQDAYFSDKQLEEVDLENVGQFLKYLISALEYIGNEPEQLMTTYATLKSGMLTSLDVYKNFTEKVFFDISISKLEFVLRRESNNHVLPPNSFQIMSDFCEECGSNYKKFEEYLIASKDQLHSFIMILALDVIELSAKLHMVDSQESKDDYKRETFYEYFNHIRNDCSDQVFFLVARYVRDEGLDLIKLKKGLEYLLEGDMENLLRFDRLEIPPLSSQSFSLSTDAPQLNKQPLKEAGRYTKKSTAEHFEKVQLYLERFGLKDTRNIKLWDIVKVGKNSIEMADDSMEKPNLNYTDLPQCIISKIISLDFKGRDHLYSELSCQNFDNNDKDMNFDDFFFGEDEMCLFEESDSLNALDILLLIYNCCHPLLQQVLCEKLFCCKLALPFLYPTIEGALCLSLWSLRAIVIEWNEGNRSYERSVVNCPMNIVSFTRIGRPDISKSKIANIVLYDEIHNTFFNQECFGGSNEKVISDGSVEAAWFMPSDKGTQILSKAFMLMNMRGDAKQYPEITDYLKKISNIMVSFVCIRNISNDEHVEYIRTLALHCQTLILVLSRPGKDTTVTEIKNQCRIFGTKLGQDFRKLKIIYGFTPDGKVQSIATIKSAIQRAITVILPNSQVKTLEESIQIGVSGGYGFMVDENESTIAKTKKQAENVHRFVSEIDLKKIKHTLLPSQGKHWKSFSEHKKQLQKEPQADKRVKLRRGMTEERKAQLEEYIASGTSASMFPMFRSFLNGYANSDKIDEMLFFLQWMKLYLDEHTRQNLPDIAKEYRKVVKELRNEKSKITPDPIQLDLLKIKEQESEIVLSESSFGLEHLMREMAQIYECVMEYDDGSDSINQKRESYEQLPASAAKMLLNGFPLELMDGDVANVPMTWIKALLNHAQSLVGDKKIFILGVLGIQSSGKSTLLNTMFGLKFAVSAGRCTRGIFMQLLPVEKKDFDFDYILVIDTEGLRSSELQQQHYDHDNELATLVIGLSDLTILNIKGEDLSEVKDILEIAVHAFLKMKIANEKLNLTQSCVFVHQNVSAVNAKMKMEHGHQKLHNTLDEMTQEAARQVQNVAIHSFKQVIAYDGDKHILYFSDLWKGDPPMAPANPGYSYCTSLLKKLLVNDVASHQEMYYSFSNLEQHIQDLWGGILTQDFLFSFRNCLEIKAYNNLEERVCQLQFVIEEFTSDFITKVAFVEIAGCTDENTLEVVYNKLLLKANNDINHKGCKCIEELEMYFESNELKHISHQWRGGLGQGGKLGKLHDFIEDCKQKAKRSITKKKEATVLGMQQKSKETQHNKQILWQARNLAEELQQRDISDDVLEQEFNKIWQVWANERVDSVRCLEQPIHRKIEQTLFSNMAGYTDNIRKETLINAISKGLGDQKLGNALTAEMIQESHLSINTNTITKESSLFSWISTRANVNEKSNKEAGDFKVCRDKAHALIIKLFDKVETYITSICVQDVPYQDTFITHIIKLIRDGIKEKNKQTMNQNQVVQTKSCDYTICPNLEAKVLVLACRYSSEHFGKMQEDYEKRHGLEAELLRYREKVFALFQSTVRRKASEMHSASLFWTSITEWIKQHIVEDVQSSVPSTIKQEFGVRKFHLLKTILRYLAEAKGKSKEDNFQDYLGYIRDSYSFAVKFITEYTNQLYFKTGLEGTSKFEDLCMVKMDKIMNFIEEATMAFRDIGTSPGVDMDPMEKWILTFCKFLRDKKNLPLNDSVFEILKNVPTQDFDFKGFQGYIMKQKNHAAAQLIDYFQTIDECTKWGEESPFLKIVDSLWGCKSQCPFCQEPCIQMNHDNDHRCFQHRPQGLSGQSWLKSKELVYQNCNSMVSSDEYKFACLHRTFKEAIEESMKVDLAFLVDATGSMGGYIDTVKDNIKGMVEKIKVNHPDAVMRVSFIAYRDFCDGDERISTQPFTENIEEFKNFVSQTKAFGGGDAAEDVFGGLSEAGQLAWKSVNRVLVHFADAPCHGSRFHSLTSDDYINYNQQDYKGLRIENLLKDLMDKDVQYYFGRINEHTDKMIMEFNVASGRKSYIKTEDASEVSKVVDLVPEAVTATLQSTCKEFRDKGNCLCLENDTIFLFFQRLLSVSGEPYSREGSLNIPFWGGGCNFASH